jgi:hypothetical protein
MVKVVALVAADGDWEWPLLRQAARLYILARYEDIITIDLISGAVLQ